MIMDDDEYNNWIRGFLDSSTTAKSRFMGVDWAAGNGMIKGEVIERAGNVTHLRFTTVGVESSPFPRIPTPTKQR